MGLTRMLLFVGISGVLLLALCGGVSALDYDNMASSSGEIVEIDECVIIDEPGNYELVDDLTSSGTCIRIEDTHGVVLDGNGHSIRANADSGIVVKRAADITVRTLIIEGNPDRGISIIQSDNVTAHHLHVSGSHHSIDVTASRNVILEDNTLMNGSGVGVTFKSSREAIVRNNTLENHEAAGIRPRDNSRDILITNNVINDAGIGVAVFEASNVTVSENEVNGMIRYGIQGRRTSDMVVRGNTIMNGILCAMDVSGNSSDVLFENNYAENTDGMQIGLNSTNVTVRGNTFKDITSSAIDLNGPGTTRGLIANNSIINSSPTAIAVRQARDSVVRNNTVRETRGDGILVHAETANVSVVKNVVTNSTGEGIVVWHRNKQTRVANNVIQGSGENGIFLERPVETTIDGNHIINSGRDGLRLRNATDTTIRNTTVRDAAAWPVRIWHNSTTTSVTHLVIEDSASDTLTLSFVGRDVAIRPLAADRLDAAQADGEIHLYFEVETTGPDSSLDLAVHYSDTDVQGMDEGTLGVWTYGDSGWQRTQSEVDTTLNVVRASPAEFGIFGIFDEEQPPTPTPEITPNPTPTESPGQPGFGVGTVALAFISAILLASRSSS